MLQDIFDMIDLNGDNVIHPDEFDKFMEFMSNPPKPPPNEVIVKFIE